MHTNELNELHNTTNQICCHSSFWQQLQHKLQHFLLLVNHILDRLESNFILNRTLFTKSAHLWDRFHLLVRRSNILMPVSSQCRDYHTHKMRWIRDRRVPPGRPSHFPRMFLSIVPLFPVFYLSHWIEPRKTVNLSGRCRWTHRHFHRLSVINWLVD